MERLLARLRHLVRCGLPFGFPIRAKATVKNSTNISVKPNVTVSWNPVAPKQCAKRPHASVFLTAWVGLGGRQSTIRHKVLHKNKTMGWFITRSGRYAFGGCTSHQWKYKMGEAAKYD